RPEADIAEALLDQRAIAGLGNIFKSETLFVARVNPFMKVFALAREQVRACVETGALLLRDNTREESGNGITTVDTPRRTARRLSPGERLWVYGRAGKPCRRCGTAIERTKQGPNARVT